MMHRAVKRCAKELDELCSQIPGEFTIWDVMLALSNSKKRFYPTFSELKHGLHQLPFIERTGHNHYGERGERYVTYRYKPNGMG